MAGHYIDGLSLQNFRAVGPLMRISPLQEVNFFIGPNNAGKSTILLFLANYLNPQKRGDLWQRTFNSMDVRLGKSVAEVEFHIGVRAETFLEKVLALTGGMHKREIETIQEMLTSGSGMLWLKPDQNMRALRFVYRDEDLHVLSDRQWQYLFGKIAHSSGGNVEHWTHITLQRIAQNFAPSFPDVHLIPAIREVSAKGNEFTDYSGRGLIDKLAEFQNPPHDQRNLRTKFDQINQFLRSVTDRGDATIEVPHDRRYLLVHMDGKVLPLSSLGTGIHEVIMLASFCTIIEKSIVCVEEPEIHLHPLLQRKLIRYIKEKTDNQYFIATHSASIIDATPASIFKVENSDGDTSIRLCVTPGERHEICRALGYRASDLLQANAIIWVEGPSDRIYLNHWLKHVAPDLAEGIDYSIMFYGGRLLSHLSATDSEVSEFISLRKLNRNVAVVIDSDKASSHSPLNATKKRVSEELRDAFSWVTKGREIENYVPIKMMSRALAAEYPRLERLASEGQFDHRLHFVEKKTGATVTKVDKVKVAKRVVKELADISELDLARQIRALAEFIRKAGHAK